MWTSIYHEWYIFVSDRNTSVRIHYKSTERVFRRSREGSLQHILWRLSRMLDGLPYLYLHRNTLREGKNQSNSAKIYQTPIFKIIFLFSVSSKGIKVCGVTKWTCIRAERLTAHGSLHERLEINRDFYFGSSQ